MITFSPPFTPTHARHGVVFSARQYPRQAFGGLIDPVINIDWFEMAAPTFPPHPHAGFSAVTYLFTDSPNGFINRDSMGVVQGIRPGGLHWSRASRGMMHEEIPVPGAGPARGLQIFVNLPAAHQDDAPAAFGVPPESILTVAGQGWTSRVAVDGTNLAGSANALPSPVRIEEVALDVATTCDIDLPAGWGGVLIVLEGALSIGGRELKVTQAIGFASDVADGFKLATTKHPARVVLVSGARLEQPIYAYGPLMLASPEALEAARRRVASLSIPA